MIFQVVVVAPAQRGGMFGGVVSDMENIRSHVEGRCACPT
jgi:hypothetical protein